MASDIFEDLPLFRDLTPEQIQLLRPMFISYGYHSGTVLFEQGASAEHLYLVVEGEVTIRYKPEDGPPIVIARIRSGGVVGWSAALGNRFYTSAAICSEGAQLVRVRTRDLRYLCEVHPDTGILILDRLASVIAERLLHTHDQVMALLLHGMHSGSLSIKEV
jgi:CRP-like cAMP-binding protein